MGKEDVPSKDEAPSRMTIALCGILVGWTGIHRFLLGDTTGGIIRLLLSCTCVGSWIGFVEGIIYIMKTDDEFYQTYVVEKKAWF
jgi:TM2 domain-containing membrane protein YozV